MLSDLCSNPQIFKCDYRMKMPLLITCAPGLEKFAEKQLLEVLPGVIVNEIQRGRLFFAVETTINTLLKIKFADNIYFLVKKFPIGPVRGDLNNIQKNITAKDIEPIKPLFKNNSAKLYIKVKASRSGRQSYSRFEAAEHMEKALAESCGYRIGNDKIFDLNFRLDIISETAWLSLKLTSAQFRFRGIRIFSEAAVRPTIANTMIWLSTPSKHDIFLDPFCGSGTIPTERSLYPSRKILASDISERAISIAKQNVTSEVIVRRADACNLNLAQNSITSIVTNLPWGIQIKTEDIEKLYYTFFKQVQAILAPTGTAIVLTDKETELIRACSSPDLSVKKLTMLSLHGLHPSIFKIFK